jgi:hypothetical protein
MSSMARSKSLEIKPEAPVAQGSRSFEDTALQVMGRLRTTLTDLFAALDGESGPISRAVDVERTLKLDKTLAWQVFRLSQASDLGETANVPSRTSIRRLLEAARRRRVPKEVLDGVFEAFAEFEAFVETHGGDRHALISMVSAIGGLSGADSQRDQLDLRNRKMRFKADTHIWGVQSRLQVATAIHRVRPGPGQIVDVISAKTEIGLRRLRQNAPLTILRWVASRNDPAAAGSPTQSPVGPDGSPLAVPGVTTHGLELFPEFCTQPLPQTLAAAHLDGSGATETELAIPPGRTGEVTLTTGQLSERIGHGPQSITAVGQFCTVPVETKIVELMVSEGRTDPTTARVVVYGRRTHPEQVYALRPDDILPQRETVTHLGVLEAAPRVTGDPRHEEAIRAILARYGWLGTRFDVYRCRVQYPVMHSLVYLCVDSLRR